VEQNWLRPQSQSERHSTQSKVELKGACAEGPGVIWTRPQYGRWGVKNMEVGHMEELESGRGGVCEGWGERTFEFDAQDASDAHRQVLRPPEVVQTSAIAEDIMRTQRVRVNKDAIA
jgi:hypothetical protein